MDKNQPILTVVVPVYNRATDVLRTLSGIEEQTHRPFEVVLVDNASTDRSLEVITEWAEKVNARADGLHARVTQCATPGAGAARNAGLDRVRTPWVMFFDSDDVMLPGHIERFVRAVDAHPEAQILGWSLLFIDSDTGRPVRTGPFQARDILYHDIFHGALSTLRYAARTDLVRSVGAWNNNLRGWDDIELGVRLALSGAVIRAVPGTPTVHAMVSAESVTARSFARGAASFVVDAEQIRADLPPSKKHWASLKEAILAADVAKAGDKTAAEGILDGALRLAPRRYRPLLRFAYAYARCGGRGIARILRPLM